MKLNLGCGKDIKKGYVNLDQIKLKGINKVHDLEKFPYPFKSNTFEEIYCSHVIEHLSDTVKVMEELHRIAKKNAKIIIRVPHFSRYNALTDVTHKRAFSYLSFDQFCDLEQDKENYGRGKFRLIEKRIIYGTGNLTKKLNWFFNPLINNLFLFKYNFYERFFCYILPSDEIYFELKVIK